MSRAFVKDAEESEVVELPDRLISEHPNLVTAEGLAQIEAEVARFAAAHADAFASGDRAAIALAARDLRYWTARRASAELVARPEDASEVHFGSTVTFVHADGRRQRYRIVGEDEADPAKGTLSYVSPLARALMGKTVGDTAPLPNGEVEITDIE
jgi:transcription elongation GreA/GreB family factor